MNKKYKKFWNQYLNLSFVIKSFKIITNYYKIKFKSILEQRKFKLIKRKKISFTINNKLNKFYKLFKCGIKNVIYYFKNTLNKKF